VSDSIRGHPELVRVLIAAADPNALPPTLPVRAHPGDGGYDLIAATSLTLGPGERGTVATGVALALPAGVVGLVLPRSGRALREGLTLVNAPGLIDAGFRGEIRIGLVNLDPRHEVRVETGERIAQLVVLRVPEVEWIAVGHLPGSHRGGAGFGSTGA